MSSGGIAFAGTIRYRKKHVLPGPAGRGRPGAIFGRTAYGRHRSDFETAHTSGHWRIGHGGDAWLGWQRAREGIRRDAKSCVSTRHRYERADESGDRREGVPDAADRHARASDRREGAARGDVASAGPGGRLEPAAEPLPQLRPARGGHAEGGVRPVLLAQDRPGGQVAASGAVLARRQEHRLWAGRADRHAAALRRGRPVRRDGQEGAGGLRADPAAGFLSAHPVRDGQDRVVPGELPGPAVRRVGHAHAPDAGSQHCRHVLGPELRRLRQAHRHRGPLAGRLAPRHRLVVREVRQVRGRGEIAERLRPGHRLRAGPRGEGRRRSSRSDWRTSP